MVFNSWHHFPTFIQEKGRTSRHPAFFLLLTSKQKDHCCQQQWSFHIQAINL